MRIQNISLFMNNQNQLPFVKKKKYSYIQGPNNKPQDSFIRITDKIEKHINPSDGVYFDKTENKATYVAQKDGNLMISQKVDRQNASIELIELKGNKTRKTFFSATRKYDGKSYCAHKISKNHIAKNMSLSWDYPDMIYSYKGSKNDMPTLLNALKNLDEIIHSEKYYDDFGHTRSLNEQLSGAINYLNHQIKK